MDPPTPSSRRDSRLGKRRRRLWLSARGGAPPLYDGLSRRSWTTNALQQTALTRAWRHSVARLCCDAIEGALISRDAASVELQRQTSSPTWRTVTVPTGIVSRAMIPSNAVEPLPRSQVAKALVGHSSSFPLGNSLSCLLRTRLVRRRSVSSQFSTAAELGNHGVASGGQVGVPTRRGLGRLNVHELCWSYLAGQTDRSPRAEGTSARRFGSVSVTRGEGCWCGVRGCCSLHPSERASCFSAVERLRPARPAPRAPIR